MNKFGLMGLLVVCMLSAGVADADIYRWTDSKGTIHFTNEPPPPGGVLVERIEEVPYDAEADRRRAEEERRLRLERQRLEIEERKAGVALQEQEARRKLEEAQRTLEEARQQAEQLERAGQEDCSDDHYLRYGTCEGYPVVVHRYNRPARQKDLYRGYTRKDGGLYYHERPRPHPAAPPAAPPVAPKDESDPLKPKRGTPKAKSQDPQTGAGAPGSGAKKAPPAVLPAEPPR